MGVNARMYGYALDAAARGAHLWGSSNKIYVALMEDAPWTPNQDTEEKWSDVSAYEITGTNYTAGGKALTFPSPYYAYDNGGTPGGTMKLKADSITWSNLTTNADIKYAVIYTSNGAGYGSPLLGFITFPSPISCTAEDFVLEWTDDYVVSLALDTANPSAPYGRMMGSFWLKAFEGSVVWADTNWKVALVKSSWSPDQDANVYLDDVIPSAYAGNELANTGNYARATLANMTSNYTDTADYGGRYDFLADDVVWSNLTSSADFYWALIFYDTGDASTSPILGYINFGANQSAVNQNVTIEWDTGVVFQTSLDTAADV